MTGRTLHVVIKTEKVLKNIIEIQEKQSVFAGAPAFGVAQNWEYPIFLKSFSPVGEFLNKNNTA